MSLFIQQKPAYLPFCLYCYTDKSDCLDYRSRSILWLSQLQNKCNLHQSLMSIHLILVVVCICTIYLRQSSQNAQTRQVDSIICYSSQLCLFQSVPVTICTYFQVAGKKNVEPSISIFTTLVEIHHIILLHGQDGQRSVCILI